MKTPKIKSFKKYLHEENEKYYTVDFSTDMTDEDVVYGLNLLVPLTIKMLKNSDVVVTVSPVVKGEEE